MREIIFRGNRKDNGESIFGYYFQKQNPFSADGFPITHYIADCPPFGAEVDPETVGQFTGLKDKNGRGIFEGDILHISKIADGLCGYYQPPFDYPVNVVVKWDLCAWMWETLCDDKRYITFPDAWCHYECEVIGNIHDNQEFMKEGADNG